MFLTGGQIRAARALLRFSAAELAEKAGVSLSTVQRAETVDGAVPMMRANMAAIRTALEAAGVEFLNGDGPGGVRMRGPAGAPAPAEPVARPAARPRPAPPVAAPAATPQAAPLLGADDLLARLRAACAGGKLSAWSREHGIQKSVVSEILSGGRGITDKVALALGFDRRSAFSTADSADKPAGGPEKG